MIATGAVATLALLGAERVPIAEYLLYPGSMVAWLQKGDNFRSSREFLASAIAWSVPINALAGAVIGVLVRAVSRTLGD